MSGTTEVKHAHFKVPRGLPGSNAIENDEAVAAYLGAVDSALTSAFYDRLQIGHIGVEKPNPVNGLLYIGSGTGTLPDSPIMGIKVKLDTPTGGRRDGIQSNVKVTPDAGSGSVRGMLSRVDLADSDGLTGDTVALWGDAWITGNSSRGAWGGNIYVSIRDDVDYKGNAHGLEVGFENRGIRDNIGGGLLVVGKGITNKAAFGIKISSDPLMGGAGTFKTNLLMATSSAPSENYIWIGNAINNTPSGAPVFQVKADGKIGINALATQDNLSVGGTIRFGETSASVRLIAGVGSPEGVVVASRGSIYLDVSGAAGTTLYVKTSGLNTSNTGWTAK
ncbi:hypothetical protein B2G67_09145 [Microbacterium foliorum]|nr:hypothetical protein B2G67_09145 [Microbacterium foliorum]